MLAGDSMSRNNNQAFSTKDRDNEFSLLHCAKERRSGWWHGGCTAANLNSQFYESKQKSNYKSIYWYHWRKLDSISRKNWSQNNINVWPSINPLEMG